MYGPTIPTVELVPANLELLDAAIEGPEALSRALGGHAIAPGWDVFATALPAKRDAFASDPTGTGWGTRLFVLGDPPTVVGWGGFKGAPVDGVVELGYAIAPDFRRRGLATTAVREMLREAFETRGVQAVIAHTLPQPNPSTKVLEATGFVRDGEGPDGQLWRWRHD